MCNSPAAAPVPETVSRPLTDKGEIALWVFVDKIPLPNGMDDREGTLQADLLPDEASLAPAAGQAFKFNHREFQWGAVSLVDGFFGMVGDVATGGKALDDSAGYLYCSLASPAAYKLTLRIGSDDSFKVYLNGKLSGSGLRERGVGPNWETDTVELDVKKGANRLLIRIDNYRFDTGVYCQLLDATGRPASGLQVSVELLPAATVWNYTDSFDYHYSYVRTPTPPEEPRSELFGARLQRTMALLETSVPSKRNKVKILFYGQSTVAGDWVHIIVRTLRERYPNAVIEVENRAIGGHEAPVLARCAAQDLYPYYPDLVVFNVYGGMGTGELERIFYNIRKYTTAEILTFPHHLCLSTDPGRDAESANFKLMAQKYDCEFANIREEWGRFLETHHLKRSDLLADGIHRNARGDLLLATLLLRHFKFNTLDRGGWCNQIHDYEARCFFEESQDEIAFAGASWSVSGGVAGATAEEAKEAMKAGEIIWQKCARQGSGVVGSAAGDRLTLEFHGNRIDVVLPPDAAGKLGTAKVLIDGKAPSSFPGVHVATRPSLDFVKSRPAIKRITLGANAIPESWVFRVTAVGETTDRFSYELIGRVTGPDGKGDSEKPFVSTSGRIRLLPGDLSPFYGKRPRTDAMIGFEVKWEVNALCQDVWRPEPTSDPSLENSSVLAQGLPNGRHTLELKLNGDGPVPLKLIRSYSPQLGST
ncbi:MAG: hypothetical protein WCS31_10360 [Verrucomicrobiae bacterium]